MNLLRRFFKREEPPVDSGMPPELQAVCAQECPRCKHRMSQHLYRCLAVDTSESMHEDGFWRYKRTNCECPLTSSEVLLNLEKASAVQ